MTDNNGGRRGVSIVGVALNILTVLVLTATLCTGGAFAAIFINPNFVQAVNPYLPVKLQIPPTLPPTLGPPTATNTPEIYLPPTWTATITLTETPTEQATETPAPTETPVPTQPTQVDTPTSFAYSLQSGSPVFTQRAGSTECTWMGVGGMALDKQGLPVDKIAVHVAGQLGGQLIDLLNLTGTAPAYNAAGGGYEIALSDHPIAGDKTLWIQLLDQSGVPLSDKVYFSTSDKCDQNLVLINWVQVR